jgi:hypothetical protein
LTPVPCIGISPGSRTSPDRGRSVTKFLHRRPHVLDSTWRLLVPTSSFTNALSVLGSASGCGILRRIQHGSTRRPWSSPPPQQLTFWYICTTEVLDRSLALSDVYSWNCSLFVACEHFNGSRQPQPKPEGLNFIVIQNCRLYLQRSRTDKRSPGSFASLWLGLCLVHR